MTPFAGFRNGPTARALAARIASRRVPPVTLMEFCGGHTVAMHRSGIRSVLPQHVRMRSGPGCPVCVTSNTDLDRAMAFAAMPGVILATYGDMLRVPGSHGSLRDLRAAGAQVEVVYSTLDALALAEARPDRTVVFFAVGFETTAPAAAAAVIEAQARGLTNFLVSSVMKLTIPGARALLDAGDVRIDGIIGPGHVSVVLGAEAWAFLAERYALPVVISGFEPLDLLAAIDRTLELIEHGECRVDNAYARAVRPGGNARARAVVDRVFVPCTTVWRGFGPIPDSGLALRDEFAAWDADRVLAPAVTDSREHPACRCGDVLRGAIEPEECRVFGTACTPDTPLGPCMVSSEGACAARFAWGAPLPAEGRP